MEQFEYELESNIDAPETVTVAAGSSVSVTVTVTLSARDIKYIEKYFENGIYVEGFITLDEVGGESISAPYHSTATGAMHLRLKRISSMIGPVRIIPQTPRLLPTPSIHMTSSTMRHGSSAIPVRATVKRLTAFR